MKKYKICVYAISKNEEKFVRRWYNSIKEADYICVLDTGSTDSTVNILKELNVNVVSKKIQPWRFDVARNESLKLIPKDTDICICLDLDEVIEDNWYNKLQEIWNDNITRLSYIYNWKLNKNDEPEITFYANKIHKNNIYEWIYPVHEILKCKTNENQTVSNDIIINHYPDNTKSRNQYLKLLELSVKENPFNDRNLHYLGREYMYYKKWNKCIDTLIKHLNLKTSTWKDERCASMRYISRAYINLNRIEEAKMWLNKAINEAPYLREPYVENMILYYSLNEYNKAIDYGLNALKITNKPKTYINEKFAWDETIYDILSICYYHLDNIKEGKKYIDLALEINPNNERLQQNKKFFI